jgi:hypothetical protein
MSSEKKTPEAPWWQRAWETLFPPPPTPADALKRTCKELTDVRRELERRSRRAQYDEASRQRALRAMMATGKNTEARLVARQLAEGRRAEQQRLASMQQVDAMIVQLQHTHDDMRTQQAFVAATRLVARFNRAVPGPLMLRAAEEYAKGHESMTMKNELVADAVADQAEDDALATADGEEAASVDALAASIYAAAGEELGLKDNEELGAIAVPASAVRRRAAVGAAAETAAAADAADEAQADDELRLRLSHLTSSGPHHQ